jgi:hypothetical protein
MANVRIIRIAIAPIDAKVFSCFIANLFKGSFAVFSDKASAIAGHCLCAIAKELVVSVFILNSWHTFARVVAPVRCITSLILVITQDTGPPIRTSTMHTTMRSLHVNHMGRKVRFTILTRSVRGAIQCAVTQSSSRRKDGAKSYCYYCYYCYPREETNHCLYKKKKKKRIPAIHQTRKEEKNKIKGKEK